MSVSPGVISHPQTKASTSGTGHDGLRSLIAASGWIPVCAVRHERGVVRRIGVDFGSREFFVHSSAQKSPLSSNPPGKRQSFGIHQRTGAGGLADAGLMADPERSGFRLVASAGEEL